MRPGQLHPNEFEVAILERIAQDEPWLRGPFDTLPVLSREHTGVGSYTNFLCGVPEMADDTCIGLRPLLCVPGISHGMGAVLWRRGTLSKCLELFTYGDDHWDGVFKGFSFANVSI